MTLTRKTPMKRGGRIKPRNAARRSREWARAFGSPARCDFVASQSCVACGSGVGNCENHHIKSDGRGRRADARFIVPLCWSCHREIHTIGRASFEAKYAIDMDVEAAYVERLWQEHANV